MQKFRISVRSITDEDRKSARAEDLAGANYIISFNDGSIYYSKTASMIEMAHLVKMRGDNDKRLYIHQDPVHRSITIRVEPQDYGNEEEFFGLSEEEAVRMYRYAYGLTGFHMKRIYV
jgi:hypothetical protein